MVLIISQQCVYAKIIFSVSILRARTNAKGNMKRKIINSDNPFSAYGDNHLDVVDKRSCLCTFDRKLCSATKRFLHLTSYVDFRRSLKFFVFLKLLAVCRNQNLNLHHSPPRRSKRTQNKRRKRSERGKKLIRNSESLNFCVGGFAGIACARRLQHRRLNLVHGCWDVKSQERIQDVETEQKNRKCKSRKQNE